MGLTHPFDLGVAFAAGVKYAMDEAKWITVKPNGANNTGRPALIDGETGQVLGGMGGKFNGQNVQTIHKSERAVTETQYKVNQAYKSGMAEAQRQAKQAKKKGAQIDMSLPDKIDKNLILQNRERSNESSIQQMNDIAAKPDYLRLATGNDFGNGAPVVAYGTIKPENLGNADIAVASDGTRYQVQYAVVDAKDVLTSNDANGGKIEEYFSDDPSKTRAIAGNGRLAAMREAYHRGTTDDYRNELINDPKHGVDPEVIKGMKNPVLVRVMQPKDITADIGDKSNTVGNKELDAIERANNDKARISFEGIETYSDGSPKKKSVEKFVYSMPVSERGSLIDRDGNPTKQAQERMMAAMFAKAYNDDNLTRMAAQSWDPDAKNVINAMQKAAANMAALEGVSGDYDIREFVSDAARRIITALENEQPIESAWIQQDMFSESDEADQAARSIAKMMGENLRSSKAIADKLNEMAVRLKKQSDNGGMLDFEAQLDPNYKPPTKEQIMQKVLAGDTKISRMSPSARAWWNSDKGLAWIKSVWL